MKEIEKLANEFPDSVQGESSAGPIEQAAKINEIIEALNEMIRKLNRYTDWPNN